MSGAQFPLDRVSSRWRTVVRRRSRPAVDARRLFVACAWLSLLAVLLTLALVPRWGRVGIQLLWSQYALLQLFLLARSKSVAWRALGRLFAAGALALAPLAGLAAVLVDTPVVRAIAAVLLILVPAALLWWGLGRSRSFGVADWGLLGAASGAGLQFAEEAAARLAVPAYGIRGVRWGLLMLFPGRWESAAGSPRTSAGMAVLGGLVLLAAGLWLRYRGPRGGAWWLLPATALLLAVADRTVWEARDGLPSWLATVHDALGAGYVTLPALVALLVVATVVDVRDQRRAADALPGTSGQDRPGPDRDLGTLLRVAPSGTTALLGTARLQRAQRARAYAAVRPGTRPAPVRGAHDLRHDLLVALGVALLCAVAIAALPATPPPGLLEELADWWRGLAWWGRVLVAPAYAALIGTAAAGWSQVAGRAPPVAPPLERTPAEHVAALAAHGLDLMLRRLPQRSVRPLPDQRYAGPYPFTTPAGLRLDGAGRMQRLDHHAVDDLTRERHGVFLHSGDRLVELLDEAAKDGRMVAELADARSGRTAFVIDLGRPVGFLGGVAGWTAGRPPTTRLTIVLERDGHGLVTAFPGTPAGDAAAAFRAFQQKGMV